MAAGLRVGDTSGQGAVWRAGVQPFSEMREAERIVDSLAAATWLHVVTDPLTPSPTLLPAVLDGQGVFNAPGMEST